MPRERVKNKAAVALGRLGAKKGGIARRDKLTPEQRTAIGRKAAEARWVQEWRGNRTDQRIQKQVHATAAFGARSAVDDLFERWRTDSRPRALIHHRGATFTMDPDGVDCQRLIQKDKRVLAGVFSPGVTREEVEDALNATMRGARP